MSDRMDLKRKRDDVVEIPELPESAPSETNYERWESAVEAHLKSRGLWAIVWGKTPCPSNPYNGVKDIPAAMAVEKDHEKIAAYQEHRRWMSSDLEAAELILGSMAPMIKPSGDIFECRRVEASDHPDYKKFATSTQVYDAILAKRKHGMTSAATKMDRYNCWIDKKYSYTEDAWEYARTRI